MIQEGKIGKPMNEFNRSGFRSGNVNKVKDQKQMVTMGMSERKQAIQRAMERK